MLRDRKAPSGTSSGSRTEFSSSSTPRESLSGQPRLFSGRIPTIHATTRNNRPLFPFGGETSTGTYDLPSPSFDDLQSSITRVSNDFQAQYKDTKPNMMVDRPRASMDARSTTGDQGLLAPRPERAGSLLRRQSTSARQTNSSQEASKGSAETSEYRRQSQYPPVSANNVPTSASRFPRKFTGPVVFDSHQSGKKLRQTLTASTSTKSMADIDSVSNRYLEGTRRLTDSVQTLGPAQAHPSLNNHTTEHTGTSPSSRNRGGNTPSIYTKRNSVMLGAHATGLGARTVSPTDARKPKRMSFASRSVPPVPTTPPTPLGIDYTAGEIRPSSKSPSMLPRKVATPVSSRTTPDANRKSFNSRLFISTSTSHNIIRVSTGSFRMSMLAPNSKIPTATTRNLHSSAGNHAEADEDVPPVPAIPKAYESPKESPSELHFSNNRRKSSLPTDSASITSTSSNGVSGQSASYREPVQQHRDVGPMSPVTHLAGLSSDTDHATYLAPVKKRGLQPMRLPPLNLLPLSSATVQKVTALHEPFTANATVTPPPRSDTVRTPSSPMTASKSLFFSRNSTNKIKIQNAIRSTTSINMCRSPSPSRDTPNCSRRPVHSSVSPFVSASVPKDDGEDFNFTSSMVPRNSISMNNWNYGSPGSNKTADPVLESRSKLMGPRAQKLTKSRPHGGNQSSPEGLQAPASGSSLGRALSLGWKKRTSKASLSNHSGSSATAIERESEYPPQPPEHDSMPPPKFPASATISNIISSTTSPSPSIKSTKFLDSKRRKSSTSSLTMFGHERTRSDSLGLNRSSPKEQTPEIERHHTQGPSASHKLPKSKASATSVKSRDSWTIGLDKGDLVAEEEMQKLGSKKKEIEQAAREVDALTKRATPKDAISIQQATQNSSLNLYERGEIIDYDQVFFCGTPQAHKHVGDLTVANLNFGYDDDRGDYRIVKGDHLLYRYEIIDVLGKGSFGQVVRCIDHKVGNLVAVKIIRNKKRFHAQALVEVNILKNLRQWDPHCKHSVINFVQSFYFRNHLCISTELLDVNLYEWIKANSFRGFSLNIVRRMARQLLGTLALLNDHKVIHCDLKPENILLSHPLHSEIKVIDFGSSCFENEKVYTYIQSRFYRSPEVILGTTYGMPIDMWSLGCILAEIYTGVPIFPGENELEQLACIMEVFGPPERHLIEKSSRRKLFFDSLGKPRINVSSKGRRRRPSSKTLQQAIKCDDEAFIDFLKQSLRWDQEKRMRPDEAIRHPFITGQKMMARMQARNGSPIRRHNSIATTGAFQGMAPRAQFESKKRFHEDNVGSKVHSKTIANFGSSVAAAASSTSRRDFAIFKENVARAETTQATSTECYKPDAAQLYGAESLLSTRPLPVPPFQNPRISLAQGLKTPKALSGCRQSSLPEPVPVENNNLYVAHKNSTGISPVKPSINTNCRQSNVIGPSSISSKRTSIGPSMAAGNSGLPRAARTFSGPRQDLASAGATAAMSR